MKVLGVDEAGRGCVIGPLVLCGALFDARHLDTLREMGVTDSKLLKPGVRETLSGEIHALADRIFLKRITPMEIDAENINQLELKATAEAIQSTKPDRAQIDVPAHPAGIPGYMRRLQGLLRGPDAPRTELVGANGADRKFVAVSAASIVAKVERDRHIKALQETFGNIGTGYPSDERTVTFLRLLMERGPMPDFVRTRWETCRRLYQEEMF
jgi:ribonuclease HII